MIIDTGLGQITVEPDEINTLAPGDAHADTHVPARTFAPPFQACLAVPLRIGQRLAMRTSTISTSTVNWIVGDHLGSTNVVADINGNLISRTLYKPWGEVRYQSGTIPTNYTYTGQYSESYINLLFYGSRRYDPALGRFIQPDTIIPNPNQPMDWDRYGYTRNNPVRYTDPSGHSLCDGENSGSGNCDSAGKNGGVVGIKRTITQMIKILYGITLSDEGGKAWDNTNAKLVYDSLGNINKALGGQLKSLVGGATFKLSEHTGSGEYYGETSGTSITFYTIGKDAIRQMNIYHEFGHVIDNIPKIKDVFSKTLKNLASPSFVQANGFLDPAALSSADVFDPNYGTAQAIQHPYSFLDDPTIASQEQWADIFANYVVGNIKLRDPGGPGQDMYNFVTGMLFITGVTAP